MEWLTDMAAKRAELSPQKIAFVDHDTGTEFTFSDVNDRANRTANALLSLGLQRGDRIAVLCLNRADFFVLLFAAQKTGVILVPLNWRQPPAELEPILALSRAKLIIHDKEFRETAQNLANTLKLPHYAFGSKEADGLETLITAAPSDPVGDGRIAASAPWYLLFTSGTTGMPKAVIQTAGMAWANMINYSQATGLSGADRCVNYLPLFHTAGINLPTLPLFLMGGLSYILAKFDADAVVDYLAKGEITSFFAVPAIYQALALHPRINDVDFAKLNSFGCGGAPVPAHLLTDFMERGATICNGMGMTETGPTVFLMDPESAADKIGSVGKAQILSEVRLEDVNGNIVQGAGEGELQLRGPGITPGYMDNPEATEAAFTRDGWLKSGDVARRDEDGYYYIVDRIKDMYISGGENVYPAEVEKVLTTHPAILEAVVIGVEDEKWGEVGAAFLVERPGTTIDTASLSAWCRERLAPYKIPKSFQVANDLPRTAAGKVRKNILKETLSKEPETVR
ncbi:AMP-binding protein [Roseibium aggregatum]|uniref:3-methylmercaptopropionyl-CoA ligase n=1 Tax=Roseibium aggregatum TaxID=187304 RepID=A0A926P3L9_9HYPH|nr:AMP-binding protein [Roseibium aggregatum]MBD1548593.1 AMP-binding protein [Roseibium aggregatum]